MYASKFSIPTIGKIKLSTQNQVPNPNTSLTWWAAHATHVLVSLIIFLSLVGLSGIDAAALVFGKQILLSGTDLAAVWIVVGSTGGYFVSRINISQTGLSIVTGKPGQTTPS